MDYKNALEKAKVILGVERAIDKIVYGSSLEAFCSTLMSHYNSKLQEKMNNGGYNGSAQDLKTEIDNLKNSKLSEEDITSIIDSII